MKTTIQYPAIILHHAAEIETRQTHYVKGKVKWGSGLQEKPRFNNAMSAGGREVRSKSMVGLNSTLA